MSDVLLEVRGIRRAIGDRTLLSSLSFQVEDEDVLFVRGPSGVGKTLLLRALACLDPLQEGTLLLNGKTPEQLGYTHWRAQVLYCPQTRVSAKGTPSELYFAAQQLGAQRGRPRGDLPSLIQQLGLEQGVLNQAWPELSGGQAQRVILAICCALKPAVLLLDEPTSALDAQSALQAEQVLRTCGAALVWVSHDDAQPSRVGGRVLQLPLGSEMVVERSQPLDQHAVFLPTHAAPSSPGSQDGAFLSPMTPSQLDTSFPLPRKTP